MVFFDFERKNPNFPKKEPQQSLITQHFQKVPRENVVEFKKSPEIPKLKQVSIEKFCEKIEREKYKFGEELKSIKMENYWKEVKSEK